MRWSTLAFVSLHKNRLLVTGDVGLLLMVLLLLLLLFCDVSANRCGLLLELCRGTFIRCCTLGGAATGFGFDLTSSSTLSSAILTIPLKSSSVLKQHK